ncbi:hypothetical protein SLEP1_g7378 [Rubroshorea leprosula]|uniref:Ycf15 n=1 Tax=Rubroshorea leprosula TaxID=152421 RepID=A0AAV5I473_9ROSI|nr:hypothetical protein SLEP1_g7378 [Rubroshorea leprosula]
MGGNINSWLALILRFVAVSDPLSILIPNPLSLKTMGRQKGIALHLASYQKIPFSQLWRIHSGVVEG